MSGSSDLGEEEITLSLPAQPQFARVARLTVTGLASRVGFSYDEIEDLRIAVGEMCSLLLPGPAGQLTFRCWVTAEAVSVIATRGLLVEPSFSGPGQRRQTTLDRGALELLALGMEEATQSGTLLGALPPEVAAKTGTAPRPGGLGTRGFVVGYFPIGRPRYAFVVVKDRGRGARDAAPFARAMVAAELRP